MLGEGWLFLGLTSKVAKFDSKGLKSWNGKEHERLRTLLKNTLKTLPDLFGIQIRFGNLQLFLFHLKIIKIIKIIEKENVKVGKQIRQ